MHNCTHKPYRYVPVVCVCVCVYSEPTLAVAETAVSTVGRSLYVIRTG